MSAQVAVKKRILVVDDEDTIPVGIIKTYQQKGDHAVHAQSGDAAIEMLAKEPFDLVITDIKMPNSKAQGIDVLRHVREKYPNIGVIVMTAYGSAQVQDEASKRGSLFYIDKPFDFPKLESVINEFFDKRDKAKELSQNELSDEVQGTIPGLQIMDVVQVNCLSRVTCTLHIKNGEGTKEGIICFNKGDITHAETTDRSGKDAFFEIASWRGGMFDTLEQVPPTVTIVDNWEQLLIESMQYVPDEDLNAKPKAKRIAKPELAEVVPDDVSHMPDRVMEATGADAVFIITHDGFSLDKRLKTTGLDISKSGDEIAKILPSVFVLGKAVGSETLYEISMRFNDKIVMVRNVPESQILFIVVAPASVPSGSIYKAIERESNNLKRVLG